MAAEYATELMTLKFQENGEIHNETGYYIYLLLFHFDPKASTNEMTNTLDNCNDFLHEMYKTLRKKVCLRIQLCLQAIIDLHLMNEYFN